MDFLVAVELVNSNFTTNIFVSVIVDDCRCFLEQFKRFTVNYIYREANRYAVPLPKLVAPSKLIIFPLLVPRAFDICDATHFRLINN